MASAADLDFPVKGSLKRFSFPRLMREIARGKSTGSLYLLSGQTKKVVFFEEGQPVFVRSNVLSECLGQILAEVGLITQEQCDQTLEAIRRTGKKQGELLVEMGILSEGNLRYGLEAQLRTKLFDIFSWEDGRYQFKPGGQKQTFKIRLDTSAEGVIVEAIQDRFSEARAKKSLQPYWDKFPVAQSDGKTLGLLPEEEFFLATLDGSRGVGEVVDSPPDPAVPSPASLTHGLLQAGLVRVSDDRQEAKEPPVPPALSAHELDDNTLDPGYEPTTSVTEYEDTPLPGELPSAPNPMGDDDFDEDDIEPPTGFGTTGDIGDLVAAEPEAVDETFDDDIELLEDDAVEIMDEDAVDDDLVVDDDLALGLDANDEDDDDLDVDVAVDDSAQELVPDDDLMDLADLDDLDDIDLGEDDLASPVAYEGAESTMPADEDPEMLGALRFNEAEAAMSAADYPRAVALLEEAYGHGFDVAELHAMLAYGRFMEAGGAQDIVEHALDLLSYAEEINPTLDIVHAYRGAIFRTVGDPAKARINLERALEINPYCELAMEIMDSLG